jgi:ribosomal protein L37E
MEILMLLVIVVAVFAGIILIYQNRSPKRVFCNYCGEAVYQDEEHFCAKKIRSIIDKQMFATWDGKSRRIHVGFQCSKCGFIRYKKTIYDRTSKLPDRSITIKSDCGGKCAKHSN